MSTPHDEKVHVRQAYGFFYMRPESEADALAAAKRPLRSDREAYEEYLGPAVVAAMLDASSLEAFLRQMHYVLTRDGEGRIISLLRRDEPAMIPVLDYQVLGGAASYASGVELVFANFFGDGWAWKAEGDELCHRSGHVTVEPK